MTEREIIIEGLERRQRFKTPDGSSCVIPANLLQDALALLKAQEPRVMTPEEVWKASVASEPIWIELIDVGLLCLPLCAILEDENDNQYAVFTTQYSAIRCPFGKYGKTWRCWTSRPTDAQRESEPWSN